METSVKSSVDQPSQANKHQKMKFILVLAFVIAAVAAEAPLEKPRGVFFLAPSPIVNQGVSPAQVEEVMARLRQQDGSDSGFYHVYLPDGRLQRVQYTTAPLNSDKSAEQSTSQRLESATAEDTVQPPFFVVPAPKAPSQQLRFAQIATDDKFTLVVPQVYAEKLAEKQTTNYEQKAANYVASVQYTDVEPISGPIYSYKSKPLTRILRYAPYYQ